MSLVRAIFTESDPPVQLRGFDAALGAFLSGVIGVSGTYLVLGVLSGVLP